MAIFIRLAEMPKWYDFKNYSSVSRFDAVEWFRQLVQRRYLISLLEARNGAPSAFLKKVISNIFAWAVKNMRGIAVEDTDIPNFFGIHGYAQYLADRQRGVISLTPRHLHEHANTAPDDAHPSEKCSTAMHKSTSKSVHISESIDAPLLLSDVKGSAEKIAVAYVDLRQPIALALKNFEIWYSEAKATMELQTGKAPIPRIRRWACYGLLQYLDLLIWQMETGARITDEVMALAVHFGGHRSAGNLRSTTVIRAKELMNNNGLDILLELAVTEAAARRPIKLEN